MDLISWSDFEKVEMRAGTVIDAQPFPEARKPAYKVQVDFGDFGIKKTSAQITVHYQPEELIGKQVLAVINFPEKQIGPTKSQFLLCGFYDENNDVVLVHPQKAVPNGSRLG